MQGMIKSYIRGSDKVLHSEVKMSYIQGMINVLQLYIQGLQTFYIHGLIKSYIQWLKTPFTQGLQESYVQGLINVLELHIISTFMGCKSVALIRLDILLLIGLRGSRCGYPRYVANIKPHERHTVPLSSAPLLP